MPSEVVELHGHIIDSLLLPRVLDAILAREGEWEVVEFEVGRRREDPTRALLRVSAAGADELAQILEAISVHGARPLRRKEARLAAAPADGVFPPGFYVTSNQPTRVYLGGKLLPVTPERMDSAVRIRDGRAESIRFASVRQGDEIVIGHDGVVVEPLQRDVRARDTFEFMASDVSAEKPKQVAIRAVAQAMIEARRAGERLVLVAGPAVVHTGAADDLVRLIEMGFVHVLFSGNALAVHDIEAQFYGTALGVDLTRGSPVEAGHQHHLRAINRIRAAGGIRAAVDSGELAGGVMHACVRHGVEYVLAGSIRDDGPLPGVITDAVEAQAAMARCLEAAGFCLMVASMLHGIAAGNLLPARCRVACVDINPSVVTKLADRGSFQAVGIVSDIAPFFSQLLAELQVGSRG